MYASHKSKAMPSFQHYTLSIVRQVHGVCRCPYYSMSQETVTSARSGVFIKYLTDAKMYWLLSASRFRVGHVTYNSTFDYGLEQLHALAQV